MAGTWSLTKGEFEQSVRMIEAAIEKRQGDPAQVFRRVLTDGSLPDRIAETMLRGELKNAISLDFARSIMGRNFFGLEEWSTLYNVRLSRKQSRDIAWQFPWGEDVLNAPCPFVRGKKVYETHFAFLGLDKIKGKLLTIVEWKKLHPGSEDNQPRFCSSKGSDWFENDSFAKELTCGFRWYLMLSAIVPGSLGCNYESQLTKVPADYEAPLAIEEVTKTILYYRKNGVYPNAGWHGRCRDILCPIGGNHDFDNIVHVGAVESRCLHVGFWSKSGINSAGLAVSRKLPIKA